MRRMSWKSGSDGAISGNPSSLLSGDSVEVIEGGRGLKTEVRFDNDSTGNCVRRSKRQRQGSVLHRNDERNNYLRRLFYKRKIKDEVMKNLAKNFTTPLKQLGLRREASMDDGPSIYSTAEQSYMDELRAEVDVEFDIEGASAKLKQLHGMSKEYFQYFDGLNSFPLEVKLDNVSYTVPVDMNSKKIRTVYNSSVLYHVANFVSRTLTSQKKERKQLTPYPVLKNINLLLKPGKQYLVLGAPGSGKSTLLKLIAGLVHPKHSEELIGNISYNGRTLKEKDEFHIENAFVYIDQLDKHSPRLTVVETFEFAYQCLTGGKFVREDVSGDAELAVERADKEHLATRLALTALGLMDVAETYVGDASVRGVSGGQRRRVTVGEMLVSWAPVLCGDEISTGLDAASTYDMIQVILHDGRRRKHTRLIALLQPSPETVSLFDEVIVLAEGQIIYAGPVECVEDYFADIGFKSPQFTDLADFLQMISTNDGADLYDPSPSLHAVRSEPPNVSELAEIFRESEQGLRIKEELNSPSSYIWKQGDRMSENGFSKVSHLSMSKAVRRRYANSFFRSTYLISKRFLLLWIRDTRVIVAGLVKNVLMGVSVGGVFFGTDDPISIQGCLFQAGLFIMLGSMQASSGLMQDRVIFYKHADANFYSAWPFVFGRLIAQLPQTTFDTFTFGSILYYMVGLADRIDLSNYFIYISILLGFALLMNQQMAVFASIASGSSDMQVYGACTLLGMMLFSGFIIAPDAVSVYYRFIYWWNPFAWAYRALIVNEFRSERWENPNMILAASGFVDANGDSFDLAWIERGYYYLATYFLLCCVFTAVGLTFVRHGSTQGAPVMKKQRKSIDEQEIEKVEIPFTPVTLSFHDICYEVTASTSKEKLTLLSHVNGILHPGQMCALMGSSGAGKTTLMDVIALRKWTGNISGEILLNGYPQEPGSFRRCSGYVEQFDIQSPELTVKETIVFSAKLRLDPELIRTEKALNAFVSNIMSDVELTNISDALIGSDDGAGLSFEQKKRLSIAVELAASPSIIFLDEPTSGLDARGAALVVKTLRKIANSGRTICATIHQPSSAVFEMFDELLLLKRGGKVVYHGKLGTECDTLVSYLESNGAPSISLGENPANWMLRVITSNDMDSLDNTYLKSKQFQKLKKELTELKNSPLEGGKISFEAEFATPISKRRELVNKRLRRIYWRSPAYNLSRILVSLMIAFVLSSVFILDRKKKEFTEVEMRARLSVIFLSFIISGIMAIISVLPVMTQIRDMYYIHRAAGMYDSASLGLALGVAEKYFILFSSALFCLVFLGVSNVGYRIQGLIGFWGFFTFNFAIYSYIGQLFVCLVRSSATALILSSVFIGLNNFFAGLIVRPQFMVGGFYALPYYISPSHYVYESLILSLYDGDTRQVKASDGSEFYDYLTSNPSNPCLSDSTNCSGSVHDYIEVFFGGEFVIENSLRNALILGGILSLTRLLTWVALKKIRFR